jgi:hypothetical protein
MAATPDAIAVAHELPPIYFAAFPEVFNESVLRELFVERSIVIVKSTCDPSWQEAHVPKFSFTPVMATHRERAAG